MRMIMIALLCAGGLSAQYIRRGGIPTGKPQDSSKGMVVTFHGKLTEFTKNDFTIATEDQPAFVIGRSHKTKFLKDGKAVKLDNIPVGAELTVDVTKDPDLHPLALNVTVEPPDAKPAAATPDKDQK
jgi:hypothetical protein